MRKLLFTTLLAANAVTLLQAQNTPWSPTSYIGIQTNGPAQAPLHVKTNTPGWGVLAIQDHSGSGSSTQAIMTFFGADNWRYGYMGPSYGQFVIESNQLDNSNVLTLSPSGRTVIGGFSNYNNITLQVHGGSYVQDNLGVGTTTPNAKIDAQGAILSSDINNDAGVMISGEYGDYGLLQATNSNASQYKHLVLQEMGGDVAIGTRDAQGYRLAVNGNAIFTKVKVKEYGNWPDYVFDSAYQLLSLSEVENFIRRNRHLPGIPSAKQMQKDGLDVGDNQAALLKKVEELTLYVIELDKKVNQQANIIQRQEQLLNRYSELLGNLKK